METPMRIALLATALLIQTTGCLGFFGGDEGEDDTGTQINPNLGNETQERILARAAGQFTNYTIAGQALLPAVVTWLNGTVGAGEAFVGVEDRNDRSGNNYNTVVRVEDFSGSVAPGQPVEIRAKLWYFGSLGNAADIDLFFNVPGTQTDWAGDDCDEFSWKVCVQEMVVPTVGVSGQPMEVGVQISQGRVSQAMDYFFQVELVFVNDVVTPYLPYAFNLPPEANGIVVSSAKAGGDEHIRAELLIVGPDDKLVEYVTYDDIAIPTESKLIPVGPGGEYVVYVLEISGGFLGVSADVPVPKDMRAARALARVEESVVDGTSAAPGIIDRCISDLSGGCAHNQTMTNQASVPFSVEGTFPLEVRGFIDVGDQVMGEVRISSPKGVVYQLTKFVQHSDESGTLGLSRDELNEVTNWANLEAGAYNLEYVMDGNAAVGHTVVTYDRGA